MSSDYWREHRDSLNRAKRKQSVLCYQCGTRVWYNEEKCRTCGTKNDLYKTTGSKS